MGLPAIFAAISFIGKYTISVLCLQGCSPGSPRGFKQEMAPSPFRRAFHAPPYRVAWRSRRMRQCPGCPSSVPKSLTPQKQHFTGHLPPSSGILQQSSVIRFPQCAVFRPKDGIPADIADSRIVPVGCPPGPFKFHSAVFHDHSGMRIVRIVI